MLRGFLKAGNKKRNNGDKLLFELSVERTFLSAIYKTPFRMKKVFWQGEYSDADLFNPSCPHLHSVDDKYKLNVYTGDLYNTKTKKIVKGNCVSKKELKKLWSNAKFCEFANVMRDLYRDKFPDSKLPDIPSFD